jgi:deoxyribodipyrimidine photo-lyase
MSRSVPELRITAANAAPVRGDGDHVLYWMTAARRTRASFALDRALDRARELGKPLVVLEALRCDYPWASDRLHAFVLAGMRDNAERFAAAGVAYHPYVEPAKGAGAGLLAALAGRACLVVGDEYPTFFHPRMHAAAAARLPVRLELVDGNGVLPLRAAPRAFTTAHAFRRHLQKSCRDHLAERPRLDPLARLDLPKGHVPADILARWPAAAAELLRCDPAALARLPVDHRVAPCGEGGARAAARALAAFLRGGVDRYDEDRNHPDLAGTSGLSPYLHFGHLGAHEVFHALTQREGWTPARLAAGAGGHREGWWGVARDVEAFLDQLVVWRELGFNMCHHRPDHAAYDALPPWALATLAAHAKDPRPHRYDRAQLDAAATHDRLWNAAQRQLVREGKIHNYMRMLWGKKILEWSPSPQEALAALIELNDRHALDGRDPNSYSGIFWVLGRYDRPWGPERPIFGKVRYMSSDNTARKLRVREYVARHA